MKKYLYFDDADSAKKAIAQENSKQAKNKTFYNITIKKTNNGKFAVVIG